MHGASQLTLLHSPGPRHMSSPETPQEHIEYFHWLALHAEPPAAKWAVGLQAARLWKIYHEQFEGNTKTLLDLIHILMPYRFAGSGFHGLWTTVLYHLRTLPVNQQIPIWRAVFDPTNHGERLVQHPERIEAITQYWNGIARQSEDSPIDPSSIHELVKIFGPDLATDHEWISLAYAINAWVEDHQAGPSFMELVFEQHNASIF